MPLLSETWSKSILVHFQVIFWWWWIFPALISQYICIQFPCLCLILIFIKTYGERNSERVFVLVAVHLPEFPDQTDKVINVHLSTNHSALSVLLPQFLCNSLQTLLYNLGAAWNKNILKYKINAAYVWQWQPLFSCDASPPLFFPWEGWGIN